MKVKKFNRFFEGKDKFPNIKTVIIDGYTVLIGKDAVSNDHLTLNMANPDDYWFHVKGVPGSHILIRIKDRLATSELKREVAKLAVINSKAKGKDAVVVCCKAKFVSKSKDMKDGQVKVDYNNAEQINVVN